jgi:hypothetical protein
MIYTNQINNLWKDSFTFSVDSGRTDSRGNLIGGLGGIVNIDIVERIKNSNISNGNQ